MAEPEWSLSARYFEACNCYLNCPCVFRTPIPDGFCKVVVFYQIREGHYGETRLDGLRAAFAALAPHAIMYDGDWSMAVYVDDRGTEAQRRALERIFSGEAGGTLARLRGMTTRYLGASIVPIHLEFDGRKRRGRIEGIARVASESFPAAREGEDVRLAGDATSAVLGSPYRIVATSSDYSYSDHGMSWQFPGRNSYYSDECSLSGP
jgi:hypothetical protein